MQQQQEKENAKPQPEVKKSLTPQMAQALEQLKMEIAQVETSIRTKDLDIKQRMQQQVELHAKIQAYQNRIDVSPVNQQRYIGLVRDYDLAKEKYDDQKGNAKDSGKKDAKAAHDAAKGQAKSEKTAAQGNNTAAPATK